MTRFSLFFLLIFGHTVRSDEAPVMPRAFLSAKSPMESQHQLQIINMNFPGLYDNVFAGIEARIVGGESTVVEKFPYQALIYLVDKNGLDYICGGSLVSHQWVLTAAHCLQGFISIAVFLGVTDRVNGPAVWSGNVSSRNQLFIHPDYEEIGHVNDIGLVRLDGIDRKILEHKDIETVALPSIEEVGKSLVGMDATASGYGSTSDTKKASNTLRFVSMPIIANEECRRTFGAFIRSTNVCLSGSGRRSVCSGDSGGPLVVEMSPGQLVQVGITSFGHKHGCTLGHPGVFTRVSSYLNWIGGHVGRIEQERRSTEGPKEEGNSAVGFFVVKSLILFAILCHFLF